MKFDIMKKNCSIKINVIHFVLVLCFYCSNRWSHIDHPGKHGIATVIFPNFLFAILKRCFALLAFFRPNYGCDQ